MGKGLEPVYMQMSEGYLLFYFKENNNRQDSITIILIAKSGEYAIMVVMNVLRGMYR